MDIGLISVRYALALLKGAQEANNETEVYNCMQSLFNAFLEVKPLREAMNNPTLSKEQKNQLLLTVFQNEVPTILKRFITLVLNESREELLQFMAASYITLYRKDKNIISGKLITATEVTPEMEQKMADMIKKKTNGTVEFDTKVDPEIIGGFILEYDTYRMDASVKSELNKLLVSLKG